jgi:glutathione synthase/RimK-type ligase-like ATP-grasp enzyme
MPEVLVATSTRVDLDELVVENDASLSALRRVGVVAQLAAWHDASVDWSAAGLVLVRTTWDYPDHIDEFLAWADSLERSDVTLLNPTAVLRWNHHKRYLLDMERAGIDIVPVRIAEPRDVIEAQERTVVKHAVGAGSVGAVVLDPGERFTVEAPSVVNPFMSGIDDGELSLFVIDGRVVRAIRKFPAADDWRVQTQWGGTLVIEAEPDPVAVEVAERAATAAATAAGVPAPLLYARIDLIHQDGRWLLLEVEAIEPSLYAEVTDEIVHRLAVAVAQRLR